MEWTRRAKERAKERMRMRSAIAAFAIMVASSGAAFALDHPIDAPPAASQRQAPADMPAALEAMLRLFVYDSGIFDRIAEIKLPQFREMVIASAAYRRASAVHRRALDAFIETVPGLMREELDALLPQTASNAARQIGDVVSVEDVNGFVSFMSSSDMRPVLVNFVVNYSEANPSPFSSLDQRERDAYDAYAQTPHGRSFIEHENEVFDKLFAALNGVEPQLVNRLRDRVRAGMCDALGDECPTLGIIQT
jgi:hypothetical protein